MTAVAEKEPPPQVPMTPRQREIYDWIVDHCEQRGYSPTLREIAKTFGVAPNCIVGIIERLVARGWLTWTRRRSRTIRPIGGLK